MQPLGFTGMCYLIYTEMDRIFFKINVITETQLETDLNGNSFLRHAIFEERPYKLWRDMIQGNQ